MLYLTLLTQSYIDCLRGNTERFFAPKIAAGRFSVKGDQD